MACMRFLLVASVLLLLLVPGSGSAQERRSDGKTVTVDLPGDVKLEMVRVPRGSFWISEGGKNASRQVEIKEDFYLGKYEVTQEQWQALMGGNPSVFSRKGKYRDRVSGISDADLKRLPVEMVSWEAIQDLLTKLNERERDSGWVFRLPTEAEWEYACRGGASSKEDCAFDFYLPRPSKDLSSTQACFNGMFPAGSGAVGGMARHPSKVGSYPANALGVHDMHGNVWELCQSWYMEGKLRVIRGGAWNSLGEGCRAASRYGYAPAQGSTNIGFRLVRMPR